MEMDSDGMEMEMDKNNMKRGEMRERKRKLSEMDEEVRSDEEEAEAESPAAQSELTSLLTTKTGHHNDTPEEPRPRKKYKKKPKIDNYRTCLQAIREASVRMNKFIDKLVENKIDTSKLVDSSENGEPVYDENDGKQIVVSMSKDEIQRFLNRIDSQCPENDRAPLAKRESMINWHNVAFSRYDARQCELAWSVLKSYNKRTRILREVVAEIREYYRMGHHRIMQRVIQMSPDFPKYPYAVTGARHYCQTLWNERGSSKYLVYKNVTYTSMIGLQQTCSQEWKHLPSEKKDYHEKEAKLIFVNHRKELDKFYAKYPAFCPETRLRQIAKGAPDTPFGAKMIFVNSKISRLDPPPNPDELLQVKNFYVDQWNALPDSKRLKWICKCLKRAERYIEDLHEYKRANPLFNYPSQRRITRLLTGKEYDLWASAHGEPPLPPKRGYEILLQEGFSKTEEAAGAVDEKHLRILAEKKWIKLTLDEQLRARNKIRQQKPAYVPAWIPYYKRVPRILKSYAMSRLPKTLRKLAQKIVGKVPSIFAVEETDQADLCDIDKEENKPQAHKSSAFWDFLDDLDFLPKDHKHMVEDTEENKPHEEEYINLAEETDASINEEVKHKNDGKNEKRRSRKKKKRKKAHDLEGLAQDVYEPSSEDFLNNFEDSSDQFKHMVESEPNIFEEIDVFQLMDEND